VRLPHTFSSSELSALPNLGQARARIPQKIVYSRFAKNADLNSPTHLSSSTPRAGREPPKGKKSRQAVNVPRACSYRSTPVLNATKSIPAAKSSTIMPTHQVKN
jgi:hypothetical protein